MLVAALLQLMLQLLLLLLLLLWCVLAAAATAKHSCMSLLGLTQYSNMECVMVHVSPLGHSPPCKQQAAMFQTGDPSHTSATYTHCLP
jgi:hypothetical protein